uniref:BPTI/Kunitz inhibitor domain-containing protein n=1 Tax=Erpetoichthys calabaricus TaxID=27687 RepID=A0A8C4SYA1_ERPCA
LDRQHCLLEVDLGSYCGNYSQRWYYNKAINACALFWYGGCDGNENRFNTENECLHACSAARKSFRTSSRPFSLTSSSILFTLIVQNNIKSSFESP